MQRLKQRRFERRSHSLECVIINDSVTPTTSDDYSLNPSIIDSSLNGIDDIGCYLTDENDEMDDPKNDVRSTASRDRALSPQIHRQQQQQQQYHQHSYRLNFESNRTHINNNNSITNIITNTKNNGQKPRTRIIISGSDEIDTEIIKKRGINNSDDDIEIDSDFEDGDLTPQTNANLLKTLKTAPSQKNKKKVNWNNVMLEQSQTSPIGSRKSENNDGLDENENKLESFEDRAKEFNEIKFKFDMADDEFVVLHGVSGGIRGHSSRRSSFTSFTSTAVSETDLFSEDMSISGMCFIVFV